MTRSTTIEEKRLLAKISKLYYEEGIRQDEIVAKLNLSRSKVSRLLQQARDEGIVRISVNEPPGIFSDLETTIEKRFRLQEAIIVDVYQPSSQSAIAREIGAAAANYLVRTVTENDMVGISWGSTLNEMVEALEPLNLPSIHIVQIIGGLGKPESEIHATDLCRRISKRLNCKMTLLPAPGIVDTQNTRSVFLSDSHVQSAFVLFSGVRVAFVGIGVPSPDSLLMRDGTILKQSEMDELKEKGAVGDIALRFFDSYGAFLSTELDQRVIGMEPKDFSKVEKVVGVAGGAEKHRSILGALRGHLIDVLITDHETAKFLLENSPKKEN